MVTILGWLLMVTCTLGAIVAILGWTWAMGVFSVAPRRHPVPRRQAVTATVVPNRVAPPVQRVHVSLWEPRPVKGEIER